MVIFIVVAVLIVIVCLLAITVHLNRIADAVEAQNKQYGIGLPQHVAEPVPGPEPTS
jgi:signal transduction histidine kinase